MQIKHKEDYIQAIQNFNVSSKYVVIKPNWVASEIGTYTEAEILDWTFSAFSNKTKIVIESYTPWRGLTYGGNEKLAVNLDTAKEFWDFYRQQDEKYLNETGIQKVLDKHGATYINITNEVWSGACVEAAGITRECENSENIKWKEFFDYIPNKLFDIAAQSTLISLSKIKLEEKLETIKVSLSIKNLFGLIPHPSRYKFHEIKHSGVPQAVYDIYHIYTSLFKSTLWICEGIKTMIKDYESDTQEIIENKNILFIGKNGITVDSEVCDHFGIKPDDVPYIKLINSL